MTQRQKPVRTTMYSVDNGQVVTHNLPWPKDSPKLEPLKVRGFTFEKPSVAVAVSEKGAVAEKADNMIPCPICQKTCKGEFGLNAHKRSHKDK